jgi:excisionase family DNA binding protein
MATKSKMSPNSGAVSLRARGALLDAAEAAKYVGTTENHIRRLVTERRIPYVKLGKERNARLRFDTARLDAWVAENSYEPED